MGTYFVFKIADLPDKYICEELELLDLIDFESLDEILEENLTWPEIKAYSGVKTKNELMKSHYYKWKNSWMINRDIDFNIFVLPVCELLKQRPYKAPYDGFYDWVIDDSKSIICEWDNKVWGKKLYENKEEVCSIGPFIGMSHDIYTFPEGDFESLSDKYLFAFFYNHEDLAEYRNKFVIESNLNKLDSILMLVNSGFIDELNLKNSSNIKEEFPDLYNQLQKGYVFSEIAAFNHLSEKLKDPKDPPGTLLLDKKNEDNRVIRRHVTVKMASKIISTFTGKKTNPPKVREMYHRKLLLGEKSSSIMISLESIFKYLEANTSHENVNTLSIYKFLLNQ